MERQYLSSSRRATKVQQYLGSGSSKPVLPNQSPSTSSPYRTPIAAASFYGAVSDTPTKKHKLSPSINHSESVQNLGSDDSHDEIDFLSQPKSLHERMRPKSSNASLKQSVPYQPMSVTMKVAAILINASYCCRDPNVEFITFPSHMVLMSQGKERSKWAWRDVQGCKVGRRKHVLLALDVIPESKSGRSVASLCSAQLEKVHVFLFLENSDSWPTCQQQLRSAIQVKEMTENEALGLWQTMESGSLKPFTLAQPASSGRTDPVRKPTPILVGERRRLQQEEAKDTSPQLGESASAPIESPGHRTRARTRSEMKHAAACDSEPILRYPSSGPFAVTLLRTDLDRLRENEYLNDTLIEFGLRFLQEHIKTRDPALAQQIYVFNTFFYQKLTEYRDRSKSFEQVRKWTNRVNMYVYERSPRFEKRYIVIPIHENMHWYLAIVVNPQMILRKRPPEHSLSSGFQLRRSARRPSEGLEGSLNSDSECVSTKDHPIVTSAEEQRDSNSPAPTMGAQDSVSESESAYVFVLDSLGTHHGPVKTALRDYLRLEARAKGFVPADIDLKSLGDPIHVDVRVPEQPNYCDCGIYLLHFFDRYFSDPDYFFRIILASRRGFKSSPEIHEAWQQETIAKKRSWWRDQVLTLSSEWTQQHRDE